MSQVVNWVIHLLSAHDEAEYVWQPAVDSNYAEVQVALSTSQMQ